MKKNVAVLALAFIAFIMAVFAGARLALPSTQDPAKEELKLQLPKAMFIGTPSNIRSPNLEPVTGKPRGPFFVPKGTRLLSAGRSIRATCSP